jgi:hypothetical protein
MSRHLRTVTALRCALPSAYPFLTATTATVSLFLAIELVIFSLAWVAPRMILPLSGHW